MTRLLRSCTLGLMIVVGIQLVSAQMTMPAFRLSGWLEANGVKLVWRPSFPVRGASFTIYRSNGDTSATAFSVVDSTNDTVYVDHPTLQVGQNQILFYLIKARAVQGVDSGKLLSSNWIVVVLPGLPTVGSYRLSAMAAPNASIQLRWTVPLTSVSGKYSVWRKPDTSGSSFAVVDSTADTSYVDKPPVVMGRRNSFVYQVSVAAAGGVTLKSTMAAVGFYVPVKRDTLTATVPPLLTAQAGKVYSYNPKVVSTDTTAAFQYTLGAAPTGMKIDSTGTITWTPTFHGWYAVGITVRSNKGGVLRIGYNITVSAGNGIVQGTVTDTAGKAIRNVIVIAYQRDGRHLQYFTRTDTSGFYRIAQMDPSNYILQSVPLNPAYVGNWYNNKTEADNADIVAVADSSAGSPFTTANFVLRHRVIGQTLYAVRGWVHDTAGLRIKGSYVVFVRAEFGLNGSANDTLDNDDFREFFNHNNSVDWRLDGISEHVFRAWTDSLGNYTAHVPKGTYIAFARAQGYPRVFYNGHGDLLSADIIRVNGKVDSIGFMLTPFPPFVLGEISGRVVDTSGVDQPVMARMLAFRDRWYFHDSLLTSRTYFADTDSLGQYTFSDLLPGNYRILAVPLGSYVPTFYANTMPSMRWNQSLPVYVNGSSVGGITLVTKPISRASSGYTGIVGLVNSSSGLGKRSSVATLTAVAGAVVYVSDPITGDIVGYGTTDANGNYSISGLAPGTYDVTVDKVGLTSSATQSITVSYDASGNAVIGTASFSMTGVTSVDDQPQPAAIPQSFALSQNFPNPFNPSTTIRFAIPQATNMTLKVYNILGQEVATLVSGYKAAGEYNVRFDAGKLASGVYLYRLEAGSFTQTKKLILLK